MLSSLNFNLVSMYTMWHNIENILSLLFPRLPWQQGKFHYYAKKAENMQFVLYWIFRSCLFD